MTKQQISTTEQIKLLTHILSLHSELLQQTEHVRSLPNTMLDVYALDPTIESALHSLLDHTSHLAQHITDALHDAEIEHIITEFHKPSGVDYLPDSLADPDRNTYGD